MDGHPNRHDASGRQFLLALAVVTVLGAVLRYWAIDFGLPLITHPDEPLIQGPAERMVNERSLDPQWFRYPAFVIDVQAAVIATVRLIDRAIGLSWETSTTLSYTLGRFVMASLGVATVWLAGLIGRRVARTIVGDRERQAVLADAAGLIAALLLAVSFIHVKDSHFLKPDVPTGFFTTLALWLTLRCLDSGATNRRPWLLAAAAVGLAASAKYTGAVAGVMPAVALGFAVVQGGDLRAAIGLFVRRAVEMSAVAVVAFLMVNPYILITPSEFLSIDNGIRAEWLHYRAGHDGAEGNDTWRWYLLEVWQRGFGPTLTPLVITGICTAAFSIARSLRSTGSRGASGQLVPLLAFVLLYYLSIAPYPVRFDRQLIPILPSLAVLGGLAVVPLAMAFDRVTMIRQHLRTATAIIAAVILLAAGPAFSDSLEWGRTAATTDTRYAALDWLTTNVAPGAVVAREWHTPPVAQDGYADIFVRKLNDQPPQWYRDNGVAYVILSSFMYQRYLDDPQTYPDDAAFYIRLLARNAEATFEGANGPDIVILRLDEALAAFN